MLTHSAIRTASFLARRGFSSSVRAERKVAVLGAAGKSSALIRKPFFGPTLQLKALIVDSCLRWYWSTHVPATQDGSLDHIALAL